MTNPLEEFFFSDSNKFSLKTWNLLSSCCRASMFGEEVNTPSSDKVFGRCSKCYEIAEFEKEQ